MPVCMEQVSRPLWTESQVADMIQSGEFVEPIEASRMTGYCERHLGNLRREGRIEFHRISSRKIFYLRSSLLQFHIRHRRESVEEQPFLFF